ncbi:hypothetical protein [Clostridium sp. CCUG 7971]|uniref:hypothetical protein n=1 Tax=Clostridium sp. CCUG 7971 TaxID=2811414 RepID=UPI001ABB1FB6|nr:hypothetical protein [Clostridium sp. CCUG 7971]MBO3445429.1 hypothetical protein [Clostridium sp. CCUG 7971]
MKNKFLERMLVSLMLIIIGCIEIIFNVSTGFDFSYLNIFLGAILFIVSIVSYIKYQANAKEIDKELSKEYDERDDLIDGKVAKFTLKILVGLILIVMFISNLVVISANSALAIILVSFIITEMLSRKYYNHTL